MRHPIKQPALYRAFQFFAALKANLPAWAGGGLTDTDKTFVNTILTTPAQRRLFARMSPNDQRHALAVGRTLQQAGYQQPALLQAGLLHDVAKSLGQPIPYRVAIVLLKAFWPAALMRISEWRMANGEWRMANHPSSFILHPFIIHAHHPAIGAAWAEEAGCEPLAVKLIARHQETLTGQPADEEEKLLAALQWADNLN
ncbi:MAG: hypothetical protein DPW09_13630 [Anaerolineae bacterium]|nr:hypothetical protein [Anaerolineales bacterium]MCQ3974480.1 hypothetical protein [Anaerolineae bacterium]